MEKMIEDVLLELPAYIGAEPYPDTDAGQDLIMKLADFIRRNFATTTAEMLEQAFEQAASGALRDAQGNLTLIEYSQDRCQEQGLRGRRCPFRSGKDLTPCFTFARIPTWQLRMNMIFS